MVLPDMAEYYLGKDSDESFRADTGRTNVIDTVQTMACRRCQRQKLQCSKDQPTCSRCQRISAVCYYSPPPDRKLWAHYKAQATQISKLRELATETRTHLAQVLSFENDGEVENPSEMAPMPSEVPMFLIDIYFSLQYNASLVFHKQSFVSDYLEGKVPNFVSFSIFAVASNLFRGGVRSPGTENKGAFVPSHFSISYCNKYEETWLAYACKQVLLKAGDPSLETIRAGLNLAHYWFYMDKRDRSIFYLNNAYRSCRVLGFHTTGSESTTLFSEAIRRCFWACWQAICVSQGSAPFPAECWKQVVGLSLPCDEKSFITGHPEPREYFDDKGNIVRMDLAQAEKHKPSYIGEMLKLTGLWCEIQSFVRKCCDGFFRSSVEKVSILLTLDQALELYSEKLNTCFRYRGPWSFRNCQADAHDVFALHCLYHLCCCVLHSSIVPLFSNTALDPMISKNLSRMCTVQAVRHSSTLLEMTNSFLSLSPQMSRFSVTTGISLFVACCVQAKAIIAQGEDWDGRISSFKGALVSLRAMKETFRPLQSLWTRLHNLFSEVFDINEIDLHVITTTETHAGLQESEIEADKILSQISEPGEDIGNVDLYTFVTGFKEERPLTPSSSASSSTPKSPSVNPHPLSPEIAEEVALEPVGPARVVPIRTSASEPTPGSGHIQQTPEQRLTFTHTQQTSEQRSAFTHTSPVSENRPAVTHILQTSKRRIPFTHNPQIYDRTASAHAPQIFERRPELINTQRLPQEMAYAYNTAVTDCHFSPFDQGIWIEQGFGTSAPAQPYVPVPMSFGISYGLAEVGQTMAQQMLIPDQQNQMFLVDNPPFPMETDNMSTWRDEEARGFENPYSGLGQYWPDQ